MAGKKDEKIDVYKFHDYNQEKNDSPYFSSIVRQCKWPSLSRKMIKIHKFCCHGNLTSHFTSPLVSSLKGTISLRSRRLEVVGTKKNGRVSPSRAPALSFAHYFQAPATQANGLWTIVSPVNI